MYGSKAMLYGGTPVFHRHRPPNSSRLAHPPRADNPQEVQPERNTMFFNISLLMLLLATSGRVLASPAHEPSVLGPQFGHHPARGMSILPAPHDSKANTTLVKRDWKKKCKGVTLCTGEGFKGSCKSWCYEPDKFEDMIHSVRVNLRSVKLEKGVDCWFVQ
ncbi:hypothetical protein CPLU01_09632 [Colletotrichum plurivorum]|uniref:Uncharacterized protein n=1 Tax=Colletotrichum plurivorum TaxID=2175906 RepID=A0A8H6K8L1_9PEZI|nr:hypothetical protein CPLU01_09632 [Colletotrichum plurivorum]